MKRKILLSLTTALFLGALGTANAAPVGWGTIVWTAADVARHGKPGCEATPPPDGVPPCLDDNSTFFTSMWIDPGMVVATGLDWLATKSQNKRTIDCEQAIAELEEALGGECSGNSDDSSDDTTDTSLTTEDTLTVTPNEVTEVLNMEIKEKEDLFDSVRYAVENYEFYSDSCQDDCVLERQNTWMLTSVAMAAASGDKILAATRPSADGKDPLTDEFNDLKEDFNGQDSPMGMWGSSAKITLHTHVQQNDINALYARDLEMNALKGVRDSDDVRLIQNDSRY